MKKFPHQVFITDNYDVIQSFPPPDMLQKRILGFDELEEDWKHTTGDDEQQLLNKLENLSHEIMEDLEEFYEEHLENNDQEEEQLSEPVQEQEQPVMEETNPEPEIQPETEQEKQEDPIQESEPPKEPSDEEILKEFISAQKHLVSHSKLKERGFKTALNGKTVFVGKLCLHKGKYDTCYKIIMKG